MTFLTSDPTLTFLIAGNVFVFLVMLGFWWFMGRNPKPGFIVPRSEPPRGLSPATMGWIYARGYTGNYRRRSMTAALVSLGVKRKVFVDEIAGLISLRGVNSDGAPPNSDLPHEEQVLMKRTLGSGTSWRFDKENRRFMRQLAKKFRYSIEKNLPKNYFNKNLPLIFFIIILTILFLLILFHDKDYYFLIHLSLIVYSGLLFGLTASNINNILSFRPNNLAIAYMLILLIPSFLAITVVKKYSENDDIVTLYLILSFLIVFIVSIFSVLMSKPTPEGRLLLDEIDGFRLYLAASAPERMKLVDLPIVDQKLFEELLPYAVALGLERDWAQAFENHLSATDPRKMRQYKLRFYSGSAVKAGEISKSVVGVVAEIDAAQGLTDFAMTQR